jgi:hypothetical protein
MATKLKLVNQVIQTMFGRSFFIAFTNVQEA